MPAITGRTGMNRVGTLARTMSGSRGRWDPWRVLRERPEIELRFTDLGAMRGVWQRDEEGDLILLDAALDRRARRCVLAHELVHAERGIGYGAASEATMEREEEQVRRAVARRLVPLDELAALARCRDLEVLSLHDVAEEFDVEEEIAALAGWLLRTRSI